ncbi:transmembrane protein 271 [Dromiciops gliroides]|uniref:transmembrane protein 271 n=1 Tax=Dromiciops gliroides TaxID=33562 RepID=UPI001CC39C89|nr:transmembrane protein 271 [Dromiciops gliroides]
MKWSVRGACAALSSGLLLACALSAAAVGLKCFSLGSELRGEPFRLGTAAGAFYSGLLLAAGLSLLGSALLCCRPRDESPAGAVPGAGAGPGAVPGALGGPEAEPESGAAEARASAAIPGSQNFLLLGVLVFMLGVLSAFAGAVIDGDTVSLVERKYSHYCLKPRALAPASAPAPARARSPLDSSENAPAAALAPAPAPAPALAPAPARVRSTLDSSASAQCEKLKDYQRGLVISTVFNSLECLLGLVNLLLVKNYKSSQARRGRRGRRRGGRGGRPRGGPGSRQHAPASRQQRRGRRGKRGGRRLQQRPSEGSLFSPDEADLSSPGLSGGGCGGGCSGGPFPGARHAVSYINVGVFHAFDEAGVEVRCGGHPSVELPGYSPSDPELQVSYPYCCRPPHEDVYPREPGRVS